MTSTNKKRPILLFVDHEAAGFLSHRVAFARAFSGAGFDVRAVLPRDRDFANARESGFTVYGYELNRLSENPREELRAVRSLYGLYRKLRPQAVHHFGLKPALYGGLASRAAGIDAVVNTLTGLGRLAAGGDAQTRLMRKIVETGLRFAFGDEKVRVVLQNEEDRHHLVSRGILPLEKSSVIKGSGVDLSLFKPVPEPSGPPVVLMAARLLREKGVEDYAAAARLLKKSGTRARFLLAGEPDRGHPSAVEESVLEQWQREKVVERLGWRSDMAELIAGSHIVCLPSFYGEGVPRILLEAAAGGRAIVAADSTGCRDAVFHERNGLLVPPRDHRALAAALARLIENVELRRKYGRAGRVMAEKHFSIESVVAENLAVYRDLGILCGNIIEKSYISTAAIEPKKRRAVASGKVYEVAR